jgi:arsenate reductase (thioredoxin)
MKKVIFACIHNAGRSQMAAAFFNRLADSRRAVAISAGTQPAEHVHPIVAEVMLEAGIDLRSAKPQKLTPQLAQGAEMLITMGCGDGCPYVPGLRRDDWPLKDPKGLSKEEVRIIRDEIRARVKSLVESERIDCGSYHSGD